MSRETDGRAHPSSDDADMGLDQAAAKDADSTKTVVELVAQVLADLLGEARDGHLESIVRDALGTKRFVDDLAELYRLSPEEVIKTLGEAGLQGAPAVSVDKPREGGGTPAHSWICAPSVQGGPGFSISAMGPAFDEGFADARAGSAGLDAEWSAACARVRGGDPFLSFYRQGIANYLDTYKAGASPKIREFIAARFGADGPRYLVTVGIGANEQFWHAPRRSYETRAARTASQGPRWIVADNPKGLGALPEDATAANTLALLSSRSGKTQETVKFDEFLDPDVPRIVLANSGPQAELAERNHALRIDLPEEIPGRFSKNLSPIVLAPLEILGLSIDDYWGQIVECVELWDLTDPSSPPAALARYLRAAQVLHGANHIYLGSNDPMLLASCDELVQFWNEGVNKGSDFTMSRYFGLPRDSHLNVEGILANHATKTGVFVLRRGGDPGPTHVLQKDIRPVNPAHAGLTVLDVDYALARANADHFGSKMPTVVVEIDEPDLMTSAVLSQLWTDAVYLYSAMIGVNPGSNPEVRHVRDRSDDLLAAFARDKT